MEIVELKYQKINNMSERLTLTTDELNTITEKMYNAIAMDPIGFNKYLDKRNEETKITELMSENGLVKPTFGMVIGSIQREIADIYSDEFLTLIKIPYFLRIKITNKTKKIFQDVIPIEQTVLEGTIEDVIKGEMKFRKDEIIVFSYLQTWKSGQDCHNDFEIGKSYFVPIITFRLKDPEYLYGSKHLDDDNCGVYLIKNNIINTPNDFFNICEEMSWTTFKKEFQSKFIIRENGGENVH